MRVPSDKATKNGGWFHGDTEKVDKELLVRAPARKKASSRELAELSRKYIDALTDYSGAIRSIGVSEKSLRRLDIGWNGRGHTFPMRTASGRIIGIRIRFMDGTKRCVYGSSEGLFVPTGLDPYGTLWICEGPTDCAAMLDLGFTAIGRPSCSTGGPMIVEYLRRGSRRNVVIMSDNDAPKARPDGTTWYPGQEGARKLAQELLPHINTLRIMRPPRHKDIREWYRSGISQSVVVAVLRTVPYV